MKNKQVSRLVALLLVLVLCFGLLPTISLAAEPEEEEPAEIDTAGWVLQKQDTTETVESQEGWITPTENGVIINYGKIVEDTGSEGWVIFDDSAPKYQNSVLEYDLTFTDATQAPWIAVAPATRVIDGKNYEGFAIEKETSIQRTGRLNGTESYAYLTNEAGISFAYDETYHIKMVTIENTITVYVQQGEGEEQRLTSFESPIGLEAGTYGFRIWRGGKTIKVENIQWSEYIDTAGWVLQKQNTTETVAPQKGWITPTETGVIIDYGQIVTDAGEGWVIFDGNAPQYRNSSLEYDITFTDPTQPDYIAVGLVTRVTDGKNYEGIAITGGTGLERTGRKDGQEQYAGVSNQLNVKFDYHTTYHFRIETIENVVTVYLTRNGVEEKLTSFESPIGLEKGSWGFRIWRGGKTITVENIKRTEIVTSHLVETEKTVPYDDWCKEAFDIPVVFAEGDSVKSISDGEKELVQGSHYSVVDNKIQISYDYLKNVTKDSVTLTVTFALGSTADFKLMRASKPAADTGWVFQKQNSTENTSPKDNWIQVMDEGKTVMIDYGQIVEDAGEGWVIFDGNAPQYRNSSLEYDITFTDPTQSDFIAVGLVTRVTDGKNYEGVAITSGTGLERTGRKNGQEQYAGVTNQLNVKFDYNTTYHFRIETIENIVTVYLTRNGVEEKLTSFESPIGLEKGSWGFRIWRGGKTITVENIERTEIVTSYLDREVETIEKDNWGKNDINLNISFGTDDSIISVTNGEAKLTEGTDYVLEGNSFTLKKAYIAAQEDSFRLQVAFARGSEAVLWVMKHDPGLQREYVWTPDQGIDMWKSLEGDGTFEMAEDGSGMIVHGRNVLLNELAPIAVNGEIEFTFEFLHDNWARDQKNHGIGSLFRVDEASGSWQSVAVDGYVSSIPKWSFINSNGNNTTFTLDGDTLLSRDGWADYKIKHRFENDSFTLWMDDQFAHTMGLDPMKTAPGGMGLMFNGDLGDVLVKKVVFREINPLNETTGERKTLSIANDGLTVQLDQDFPRVVDYTLNGKTMDGAKLRYDYVTINTVDYPAVAEITKQTSKSVTYHITPDGSGVRFDVQFTVLDDHILEMLILNIYEPENELVYSIGLPDQPLISADSTQEGAALDASWIFKGPGNWGIKDLHEKIDEVSTTADFAVYIPIISNGELSASMFNNVYIDGDTFVYRAFDLGDGVVSAGFWNNQFLYRGLDNEKVLPFVAEPDEENLYCRVAIAEDTNDDNVINWQDGANAVKKLTNGSVPGGDQAARSFFHVGYNFSSGVQQPFLKVADNMKRLSNLMDGFGQQLIFKGYANEGHDSGHADYEDINQRAGGAEDMNVAIAEADKINSNLGVHLNNQEAYPEAKMYVDGTMSGINGWAWMDQSKYIRRDVDMLSGNFDKRLDELFEQVPDLDLVYVDCWQGDRWNELKFIGNMMRNGAELFANENAPDFNRFGVWVHSTGGTSSNGIHQFVFNNQKDVYPSSGIYWGGYGRGASMMSWQHNNNINGLVEQFYTNQLPQKYLMCHEVLRVDNNIGYFSGNVTSGNYVISKDGAKLTDGTGKIFIPWYAEDSETKDPDEAAKIYHWNSNGGNTEWTLPQSWQDLSVVYLYKTTQTGKVLVETIQVTNGKVTINAEAKTPYVLYPENAEADVTEWSVGSPVSDTGFNSRDFSIWQKGGDADIQFSDDGNGVSILTMTGTEAGQVSQIMTGLVVGQKYRVKVDAGAENGKTARITVKNGDETVSTYLEQVVMQNNYFDDYARNKMVQRMWVDFVATDTTAELILSADACESADGKATFMEVRIVKTAEPDLPEGYVANETFEYVEQGAYGIFNPERAADGAPHLSETHLPYTSDTISGNWSLKKYGHYGQGDVTVRTSPATTRLQPNTTYVVEFDTLGNGKVYVQSETDSSNKPLEQNFSKGHSKFQFTTGDMTDYVIRIENGSVLDNFQVYDPSLVTAATGVRLEKDTLTLSGGGTATLVAVVLEEDATNKTVSWTTSNATVATVSATGVVTGHAAGTAVITVRTNDGGYTAACTVIVKGVNKVNKSELEKLYNANKDLQQSSYTDDSWAAFTKALNNAKTVLDDADATQNEVDEAKAALESAIAGLVEKPAPEEVDKSVLEALYNANKDRKQGSYTNDSWAVFTKALNNAKTVLDDADATQEEVDAAANALRKAIAGLEEKPTYPVLPILPGNSTSKPVDEMNFTDISKSDWFYNDVKYVYDNGIMNGVSDTRFAPESTLTRAMVVTILYRMEGEPSVRYNALFSDVENYQWYTDGVEWAAINGIVLGYTNGKFGPNDPVTREQLAAILYRYAQSKNYVLAEGADLAAYADASNISPYAVPAVKWSVTESLLESASGKLLPRQNATRAEVAHAIAGFCQNVGK